MKIEVFKSRSSRFFKTPKGLVSDKRPWPYNRVNTVDYRLKFRYSLFQFDLKTFFKRLKIFNCHLICASLKMNPFDSQDLHLSKEVANTWKIKVYRKKRYKPSCKKQLSQLSSPQGFFKDLVQLPNDQKKGFSIACILPVLIYKIPVFLIIQTKFYEKLQINLFLQANNAWIRWRMH